MDAELERGNHTIRVEKDVAVTVDDGTVLRANVYRPDAPGRFPVVMTQGAYGKDVHFADAYTPQWDKLTAIYPGLATEGSTGRFLRWETVDPERWVPDGYVVVNVDSRGTGKSPGFLDPRSPREISDFHQVIEWAAAQPWSNGKVGLLGISYYAITQWRVAATQPPHLAAIIPWEGMNDSYRDGSFHGGIMANGFTTAWWPRQVLPNQHGNADTSFRDRDTGERNTGPATLSPAMLAGNRTDLGQQLASHPLDDEWHRERSADLQRVTVPVLSAGNWGGPGLHLRGNIEGYLRAGSTRKWLSLHIGTHYESFYLPRYVALQKRFFDRFLKELDNGWERDEPAVRLVVRQADGTGVERFEQEWPPARTEYVAFHLDATSGTLDTRAPTDTAEAQYQAPAGDVSFTTAPFAAATEFTGHVKAQLTVASATADMDLFVTLHLIDPQGEEVVFVGAHEPTPLGRGWLRASHRKLDPERSLPFRPWHAHDEVQPLEPGRPYEVEVEVWPLSIAVPQGYRIRLTVSGQDFQYPGTAGRMLHTDPADRSPTLFAGTCRVFTGPEHGSRLVLPRIPESRVPGGGGPPG